jgi:hypothetical protein
LTGSKFRFPLAGVASMKHKKLSLEEKWHEQAEALRREAELLPYGEELLRKARQLETASHVNEWLGYLRRA